MKAPKRTAEKVADLPQVPHAYKDYPPPEHAKPIQAMHAPAPVPFVPPPKATPAPVVPWLDQAGAEIAALEKKRIDDPKGFARKPRDPSMTDNGADGEANVRATLLADALADLCRRARDIIVT